MKRRIKVPQNCYSGEVAEELGLNRTQQLSWMASMALAGKNIKHAEGYLLELLAWCVFKPDYDDLGNLINRAPEESN